MTISRAVGLRKYAIDEAVADGAVVPLLYEGRFVEQQVNGVVIDKWFEKISEGLTDSQKADLKRKFPRMDALSKTGQAIRAKAFDKESKDLVRGFWSLVRKYKDHLCAALKAHLTGGKARIPAGGKGMLDAFSALSGARTWHSHGPNPITWEAMAAWSRIMRVPIEPRHAEIIMALDDVWMTHIMQRSAAPEGVKTLPPVSEHPINAALLDVTMG